MSSRFFKSVINPFSAFLAINFLNTVVQAMNITNTTSSSTGTEPMPPSPAPDWLHRSYHAPLAIAIVAAFMLSAFCGFLYIRKRNSQSQQQASAELTAALASAHP